MHFSMKKPCDSCPFRSDITFPLHPRRTQEILDGILIHDQTFACHKTLGDHEDDGEYVHMGDEQHCAGAMIMAERLNRPNQLMRIMERLGVYDRTKLDMDAPVFASPTSMIRRMQSLQRHEQSQRKR